MAVISMFALVVCLLSLPSVRPSGLKCDTTLDNEGLHITCSHRGVHSDSSCAFMQEYPFTRRSFDYYLQNKLWLSIDKKHSSYTLTCMVSFPEVMTERECQTFRYRLILYPHAYNLDVFQRYTDIAPNNCQKVRQQCLRHALPYCGKPMIQPMIHQRIMGGQDARRGAYPWMVSLSYNGFHKCGGAVISERLILTAAHCFDEKKVVGHWLVTGGRHNIYVNNAWEQKVRINSITIHEDYVNVLNNDIALLTVDPPLRFNRHIKPICLPTADMGVNAGQECMLAGWGYVTYTKDEKRLATIIQQVKLPVIPDSLCLHRYGTFFSKPQLEKAFCAGYGGYSGGVKDACKGDSGGPLVCKSDGKWFVQGITSWGTLCGQKRKPGVYTDVSKHATWLQEKISSLLGCDRHTMSA